MERAEWRVKADFRRDSRSFGGRDELHCPVVHLCCTHLSQAHAEVRKTLRWNRMAGSSSMHGNISQDLRDTRSALGMRAEQNLVPTAPSMQIPPGLSSQAAERRSPPQVTVTHTNNELSLLQWKDWEEGKDYVEVPQTVIHYDIEWQVMIGEKSKKNKRKAAKDTEQNVVLVPAEFWLHILHPKLKKLLKKKVARDSRLRAEDTAVVVSINDRSEHNLTKRFDGLNIDWSQVENQLRVWGDRLRDGKRLRVILTFNFVESDVEPTSAAAGHAQGGRRSATSRMLGRLSEQTERDEVLGRPAVWREVYELMRCPGPPCDQGPYCWRDFAGKKHYKVLTHQMKHLVEYKQEGNKLDTHDDVPESVREELYAVEQQRLERRQRSSKATAEGTPTINITNVLPDQTSTAGISQLTDALACDAGRRKRLKISGKRDVAVREYTNWQRSNVVDNELKTQYERAGLAVLKYGWDLEQMHLSRNSGFLVQEGVLPGIAERYVDDIAEWQESRD